MLALLFLLSCGTALAGDEPGLWVRQLVGGGGWPSGAISDTRMQYRVPGHRSDSVLFQDTFYGIGGRVQVSPAFVDIGPRISLAPLAVFDLDLQASWTGYAGPYAPLGFDAPVHRTERDRNARNGEEVAMYKWELAATPTLKAKVGPVIAFDSLQVSWIDAHAPEGTEHPYWYEPRRDMVIAWRDVTLENQGAVVYEVLPGADRPLLWAGATARHRQALVSGERYTNVGPMVMYRPGTAPAVPTFIGQALFYVADVERVGSMPNLALAATWTFDRPALGGN